jgi:hypothetical protein
MSLAALSIAGGLSDASPPALTGTANILVWMGQSNAACAGSYDANGLIAPPANVVGMTDVYIWDPYNAIWLAYQPGINSSVHQNGGLYQLPGTQYWGGEAEYARKWKIANPGVPLFIVKSSFTSTSLDTAARTTGRGCWDKTLTNDLYVQTRNQILSARTSLAAKGATPYVRDALWTQGENDMGGSGPALRYNANLVAVIDGLRADGALDATSLFVISRTQAQVGQNATNIANVRAAQEDIGTNKAYCRMFDTDSIPLGDGVHFLAANIYDHGQRAFDAAARASDIVASLISRMTVPEDAARQEAMTTMFQGILDAGIWGTTCHFQAHAMGTQQAALLDAKNPALVPTISSMGFVANQGFKNNGSGTNTNAWLDTKMVPSADPRLSASNAAYGVVIRNAITGGSGADMGCFGNNVRLQLYSNDLGNNGAGNGTAGYAIHAAAPPNVAAPASASGLWVVQRSAQGVSNLWNKGVQLGANDATAQSAAVKPDRSIYLANRNNFNSTSSNNQYCLSFSCSAMTALQQVKVHTAINTFLTGIGAL